MVVTLTQYEMSVLFKQDPNTEGDGGFQSLLVSLQRRINRATGDVDLTAKDLEKIPRYAFDYQNGGWEQRLKDIFTRTFGPNLGR
ncbi:MAG: aspartyl-tRNA synthetase [Deltaproteobacteria bacterium]|nr:aspartyl-tRNA synthetase [Deltaproteobacteria bacterium]